MKKREALDILIGLMQAIREMKYQGIIHETFSLSISIRAYEAFEIACKALKKEIDEESKEIKRYDVGKMFDNGVELCVTSVYKALGKTYVDLISKKGTTYACIHMEDFKKTGHIDSLDKWLEGE